MAPVTLFDINTIGDAKIGMEKGWRLLVKHEEVPGKTMDTNNRFNTQ